MDFGRGGRLRKPIKLQPKANIKRPRSSGEIAFFVSGPRLFDLEAGVGRIIGLMNCGEGKNGATAVTFTKAI